MWTRVTPVLIAAILASAHAFDINTELTGRVMEQAKEVDAKCRASTGTPREKLHKYVNEEPMEDEDFKCYMRCLMMEFNSLSEDGLFVLEEELENIPPEIKEEGHRVVHNCKHITHDMACETAFQIHKCYRETDRELYNFVVGFFDKLIDD